MIDHLKLHVAGTPRSRAFGAARAVQPGCYGAFVLDPDANNLEAVHHTF